MTLHEGSNWWEAIKERLVFYVGITAAILIDTAFLLIQRLLVLGEKWCVTRLHVEDTEVSLNLLQGVFVWGTFFVVFFYVLFDVYTTFKKIASRMKRPNA